MSVLRNLKGWLHLYITGFTMGAADVVPGVSGGTMAFIMGVYAELIENLANLGSSAVRHLPKFQLAAFFKSIPWKFFIVLGAGVLSAIISFASIISHLIDTQPANIFAFFGGLILASAIAVCGTSTLNRSAWISLLLCSVVTAWLVALNPMEAASHSLPVLFVAGMIAISAMILPGISGSFILLILGHYEYILEAVHNRDLVVIATVAAGCGCGILLAVHIVNFFLKRFHGITIAGLVGIMLGSLRLIVIRVEQGLAEPGTSSQPLAAVICLFLVGFILVTVLDQLQSRKNPVFQMLGRRS